MLLGVLLLVFLFGQLVLEAQVSELLLVWS